MSYQPDFSEDEIATFQGMTEDELRQRMYREMLNTRVACQEIARLLSLNALPDIITNALITNTTDTILDRQGRNFMIVFTPTAVTGCTLIVNALSLTFTLAAGWNIINSPDQSILRAPANTSQQIVIKATNWYQGGAI